MTDITAILGIGCIIDKNVIVDKFEENKFIERHLTLKNRNLNLRVDYNEILYDHVNAFLKDNKLPFEFYTPITESEDDGKKYYLIYTLINTNKSKTNTYESVNFELLINEYQTIKQFFEKTLALLFGELSVNKFDLQIISNFSYEF